MPKKTVNWAAIKKRYLTGEKPKSIAEDYGLTAKQVSDKASYESWTRKKTEVFEKIENKVLDDLEEIHSIYGALIKETGKQIYKARKDGLLGLTVQDGEGFINKFAEHDHKAGLASYLEKQKHAYKLEIAKLGVIEPPEDPSETNKDPEELTEEQKTAWMERVAKGNGTNKKH